MSALYGRGESDLSVSDKSLSGNGFSWRFYLTFALYICYNVINTTDCYLQHEGDIFMAKNSSYGGIEEILFENQTIVNVEIEREMKKSYMEYAMSVIVSRALPDVRDGLKPVHRRIIYTMHEANLTPDKAFRKSATVVGDAMGKYHPHGDAAVYDTMVRMAQDFSMRYPIVEGHGNFGSVDGDPAAAQRYTEARMSKVALEMLTDIECDTIDFMPNYDNHHKEPTVLPTRLPSLLLNGSMGIAVGMTTNIPPHNLSELMDGLTAMIEDPEISIDGLMEHIKGPDFPTGGHIIGVSGIRAAYHTGRGRIVTRAKCEIEDAKSGRQRIVISEIPYQVNKAKLVEAIAEMHKEKKVEGISDLRDESGRNGMHIVIDLKKDANAQVLLNQLYKHTQLQDSFSVIMLTLVDQQPKMLNLKQMLYYFLEHRRSVVVRRTEYELRKAKNREHILQGYKIAIDNIDEVIEIIKSSSSIPNARERLAERFGLSDLQTEAIVAMPLGRLTGLEVNKIENELSELAVKIADLEDILANSERVNTIIKDEIAEVKRKLGDNRRTSIEICEDDIDIEDLIEVEDCILTRTRLGYIKRQSVDTYRSQHRGGRGISGQTIREEDYVEEIFVASTHDKILFFTNRGRFYRKKGYQIPEASRVSKGANIVNLIQTEPDENITAVLRVPQFGEGYVTMVTRNGIVKRTRLCEYENNRSGGVIGVTLNEGDELVDIRITDGEQSIVVVTKNGKGIHFKENDVRVVSRKSIGVKAMELDDDDCIIGAAIANDDMSLLTVTENGYGKRTAFEEYRIQNRGGKGLIAHNITPKTGVIAGIKAVQETDDIILVSSDGVIIRVPVREISTYSRNTQGVSIMRLSADIKLVNVARIEAEEEIESIDSIEENESIESIEITENEAKIVEAESDSSVE